MFLWPEDIKDLFITESSTSKGWMFFLFFISLKLCYFIKIFLTVEFKYSNDCVSKMFLRTSENISNVFIIESSTSEGWFWFLTFPWGLRKSRSVYIVFSKQTFLFPCSIEHENEVEIAIDSSRTCLFISSTLSWNPYPFSARPIWRYYSDVLLMSLRKSWKSSVVILVEIWTRPLWNMAEVISLEDILLFVTQLPNRISFTSSWFWYGWQNKISAVFFVVQNGGI
jgi:hypothetical protein